MTADSLNKRIAAVRKDGVPADRETRCGCVEEVNGSLAKLNERLSLSLRWTTDGSEVRMIPIIETERVDAGKRTRRRVLLPTYCPFCGRKYPEARTAAQAGNVAALAGPEDRRAR